jgi:hypothetical protein
MAITNLTYGTGAVPTEQKFLSGSGTYITPANCLYIRVRMVGGGGGGGGSNGSYCGDGGGAGGYCEFIINNPSTSYVYSVGAGGSGGGAGSTGGTGGTTTFGLAQATGGIGGQAIGNGGGGGGTATLNGQGLGIAISGNGGTTAGGGTSPATRAGAGGAGVFGGGAQGYGGHSAYANSGAGGAGAIYGSNSGGNGGSGIIIVEEFYSTTNVSSSLMVQAPTTAVAAASCSTNPSLGAGTTIVWNTAETDDLGMINTSNGQITCKVAGKYLVQVACYYNGGNGRAELYKNGAQIKRIHEQPSAVSGMFNGSCVVKLSVGDVLTIVGVGTLSSGAPYNYVSVSKIGD